MRQVLVGIAALAALIAVGDAQAAAPRPYCLDADRAHLKDCSYHTFQQCLATAQGLGGICYENPAILWQQRYGAANPSLPRKARKRSD